MTALNYQGEEATVSATTKDMFATADEAWKANVRASMASLNPDSYSAITEEATDAAGISSSTFVTFKSQVTKTLKASALVGRGVFVG